MVTGRIKKGLAWLAHMTEERISDKGAEELGAGYLFHSVPEFQNAETNYHEAIFFFSSSFSSSFFDDNGG